MATVDEAIADALDTKRVLDSTSTSLARLLIVQVTSTDVLDAAVRTMAEVCVALTVVRTAVATMTAVTTMTAVRDGISARWRTFRIEGVIEQARHRSSCTTKTRLRSSTTRVENTARGRLDRLRPRFNNTTCNHKHSSSSSSVVVIRTVLRGEIDKAHPLYKALALFLSVRAGYVHTIHFRSHL